MFCMRNFWSNNANLESLKTRNLKTLIFENNRKKCHINVIMSQQAISRNQASESDATNIFTFFTKSCFWKNQIWWLFKTSSEMCSGSQNKDLSIWRFTWFSCTPMFSLHRSIRRKYHFWHPSMNVEKPITHVDFLAIIRVQTDIC